MLSTVVIRLPARACRMPSVWEARKSGFNSFFPVHLRKAASQLRVLHDSNCPTYKRKKSMQSTHTYILQWQGVRRGQNNFEIDCCKCRVLLREKVDLQGVPVSSCVLVGSVVTLGPLLCVSVCLCV